MREIFEKYFMLEKFLQHLTVVELKLYVMITLCVLPNLKCDSMFECIKCIILCVLLDSIYILPAIL